MIKRKQVTRAKVVNRPYSWKRLVTLVLALRKRQRRPQPAQWRSEAEEAAAESCCARARPSRDWSQSSPSMVLPLAWGFGRASCPEPRAASSPSSMARAVKPAQQVCWEKPSLQVESSWALLEPEELVSRSLDPHWRHSSGRPLLLPPPLPSARWPPSWSPGPSSLGLPASIYTSKCRNLSTTH